MNRRTFLKGAGLASLSAFVLNACGGSAAPSQPSGSSAPVASPSAAANPASAASTPAAKLAASSSAKPAASSAASAKPSGAAPATVVNSAFLRLVGDSPSVIANARGYFKDLGLTVNLQPFDGGSKAMPALSTGQLDLVPATVDVNFFNAVGRGIALQVGADDGSFAPGHDFYGIAIRKDLIDSGKYKSQKDFKGMKIAVSSLTGSLYYMLTLLLQKNGLTPKDVETIPLPFADSLPALKQKAIDAAVLVEPFASRSEEQADAKVVVRALDVSPDVPGAHMMMSPEFTKKGDVAVRFFTGWLHGVRDYLGEYVNGSSQKKDDLIKLLQSNNINIVPAAQNPIFDPDGKVPLKPIKDLYAWAKAQNQIQGAVDVDRSVNLDFVTKAAQALGPFKA